MDLLIGHADPTDLRTGCPLNNLVQEMSPIDSGFKRRLQRALNLWIDGIESHIRRGQAAVRCGGGRTARWRCRDARRTDAVRYFAPPVGGCGVVCG